MPGSDDSLDLTRGQVLRFRFTAQQLDRPEGSSALTDPAVLDIGVQETGPDGAGWALANRGVEPSTARQLGDDLVLAWTLRGAPHFYRRADIAAVAAATAPFSEADAAKRIFDAAKPLRAAEISPLDALDEVARQMRSIVTTPMAKGEVSTALTGRLGAPYLRQCRVCKATHAFEQPFRLGALRGGLELRPHTSPPVLQRIPEWAGPASRVPRRLDVIRACLHLLGPATAAMVARFLDATQEDIRTRWPEDALEVSVEGKRRWLLAADRTRLRTAEVDPHAVRLLGPFDLFLQAQDRDLLVPHPDHRKRLWVVLGRPGGILQGADVVGTWRPRASGKKLKLLVDLWRPVPDAALAEQAERLAAFRGVGFAGLALSSSHGA